MARVMLILALLWPLGACCQKLVTLTIQEVPVERVSRSGNGAENFYFALVPQGAPRALLVILPGFGGFPRNVLEETDLPLRARAEGYVVIIPYLAPQSFYTDAVTQHRLETLIPEVMERYAVPAGRFIIGGHSAGGNGALLYAEKAYGENNGQLVKPHLVFGVDPPLDMKRLWGSFTYFREAGRSRSLTTEANFFLKWFADELGGTPVERPDEYERISSFYRDAKDGGKIGNLRAVPVRLYCDPDIQWYLDNWFAPYEHINASDLSACIAQLRRLGNDRAELVTNIGKGHVPGVGRHPHGFSQLDAGEFLRWVEQMLEDGGDQR